MQDYAIYPMLFSAPLNEQTPKKIPALEHDHMFTLAEKSFKGTIIQSSRGLSKMQ